MSGSYINIIKLGVIASLLLGLTSCAIYSNKFACPDAGGAHCAMLSEVDAKINSGEIEEVYKGRKCKGKRCNNGTGAKDSELQPEFREDKTIEVRYSSLSELSK